MDTDFGGVSTFKEQLLAKQPIARPRGPGPLALTKVSVLVSAHAALVDGALVSQDVGLNAMAETGRYEHLHCLNRHLHNVLIEQRLSNGWYRAVSTLTALGPD